MTFQWGGNTGILTSLLSIPANGLIFLEVKDWKLSTLEHIDPQTVILGTEQEEIQEQNPLLQVREYACATVELLSRNPKLQQNTGLHKGQLNVAWAYGVVFTNITRQQLTSLSANGAVESIFPRALTICQDEMTESVSVSVFRSKISGLFTTRFRPVVTPAIRDILRQHLFPEIAIRVKKKSNQVCRVMDLQQEVLARNPGKDTVSYMVWRVQARR